MASPETVNLHEEPSSFGATPSELTAKFIEPPMQNDESGPLVKRTLR